MTRNQPSCVDNSEYLAYVRQNYLTRLAENLPKTVLEKDHWLTAPPIMQQVSGLFEHPCKLESSQTTFLHSSTLAENILPTFESVASLIWYINKHTGIVVHTFLGIPALEEALHPTNGEEVHPRDQPTEKSTGNL